jgi:septum formation protein
MKKNIILASSSPYRQQILKQAGIPFTAHSPNIDESPLNGESAEQLVSRLSLLKAQALQEEFNNHLIIGSDQVVECQREIFGKPRDHKDAVRQLEKSSGSTSTLFTGLCLLNTQSGEFKSAVDRYEVEYRTLSPTQIENYLNSEKPYDCCGSLKVEGPGINLIKRLTGDDPNALLGLPLLRLIDMLANQNVEVY